MLTGMKQWMKRHKILTGFAALLLLAGCGAVLGEDPESGDAPSAKRRPSTFVKEKPEESSTPSQESVPPSEEPAVVEPTPQEVWDANYVANNSAYIAAVATALVLRPKKFDAQAGSLAACTLLEKERKLNKRVAQVQASFALNSAPTYDQALATLDATTGTICPEFAAVHQAQTAERSKRLKAEAQRRKKQERIRKEREAKLAEEEAKQQYVYFGNCTDVRNAGAAPIYAGDPGYSRTLDRDGDGVACE